MLYPIFTEYSFNVVLQSYYPEQLQDADQHNRKCLTSSKYGFYYRIYIRKDLDGPDFTLMLLSPAETYSDALTLHSFQVYAPMVHSPHHRALGNSLLKKAMLGLSVFRSKGQLLATVWFLLI